MLFYKNPRTSLKRGLGGCPGVRDPVREYPQCTQFLPRRRRRCHSEFRQLLLSLIHISEPTRPRLI
eukprot:4778501-Amphidinium_carterae.1